MTNKQEISIDVKNITHQYASGAKALSDVSFQLGTGLFGLLGANGAGKSTLMRIICTLLEPTGGQLKVGGYDVVQDRQKVRQMVGYLPQEFGAWRLQKVEEVVDTLAILSGVKPKKLRKERVEQSLKQVGLTEVKQRKVHKLSGGMLRRLGVAQALVHDPQIIVMDEPSVGLDPEERVRFRQLMSDLSRERTVLISTHIVSDLGNNCSQLVLINDGSVAFCGKPAALIDKAKGKVAEFKSGPEQEISDSSLPDGFEVVTRAMQDGRRTFRGVDKTAAIPSGAVAANDISLEEAYLAFSIDQGWTRTPSQ